jgi:hypothetical protein
MKKFDLPNSHNRACWGKALLTAGLLMVAVAGVLKLHEVQGVFSPGSYHATELKLIKHQCTMIDNGLMALRTDISKLQGFSTNGAPSSSPQLDPPTRTNSEPGWPAALHKAKKDRCYVARKLNYIDVMLKSMQHAIERQRSSVNAGVVDRYLRLEQTLAQIQEIRDRCQRYNNEIAELSENKQIRLP